MKRFFFVLSIIFLGSVTAQAQIFDRLTRTIDDAVDEVTDKLTEKMVERLIEKMFSGESTASDSTSTSSSSDSTSAKSPSSSTFDLGSLLGGSSVDKSKVFDFTHRMKVEVISDESTQNFNYFFNGTYTYIGVDVSSMFIILETETQKTYAIMNDKLITMNMKSLVDKMKPKLMNESTEEFSITKTGRKEMIAGFMCEEYIIESDESTTNAWITQDFFNMNIEKTAFIQELKGDNENTVSGAIMRYEYVEKKKPEEKMIMNVLEFVPESKTIALKDY